MEQSYPVTVRETPVGKVLVQRQGLYYHISCRCQLKGDTIYRLFVSSGTTSINLGVVVPIDNGFMLNTKLPVKKIGEGELSFALSAKQKAPSATFIPITPEEPYSYIARLKDSFLTLQDGQVGILLSKKQEQ